MATAQKQTCLLYTEAGAKAQMATTPGVKDIQKNWFLMDAGYATNGQMAAVVNEMMKIFEMVNEGDAFNKKDEEYKWAKWTYGTPDGSTVGLYLEVLDVNSRIVPQLEADLASQLAALGTHYGFVITNNATGIQQPYKLYQQITFGKK